MRNSQGAKKILVIKLGALGDIILAMEAFHAIRAKHAEEHITLLTRKPFVKLASQMPWFNEVLVDASPKFYQIGKILKFRKVLREGGYTRVYDLQGNDRSGFYFKLMGRGQPEWCGTVKGCSHRRHDHRRDPVQATERMLRFLESVDVSRAGAPELGWLTGDVDGLGLPEKYVVLVPGCAPQHPHKRWPAEHFAKLAGMLEEKGIGAVALGTSVDAEVIEEIREICPSVVSLAGKTDIGQLAEVAKRAEGAVGNDTGPIHIAAVAGAPTLSLMSGRSDPKRMTPRGPDVGFLQKEDLNDLSPAEVMESLRMRK